MGLMTIIYALFVFCILIFVHELGHFAAAKAVGIKVNEFAIGMGPVVFQFTKGETAYSLKAFPIGGSCSMEGEDEDSTNPRAFNNKSFPAKALVVVAGSFMNLVTTIVILTIMAGVIGVQSTQLERVTEGMPAELAGIQGGDKIVRIDDLEIENWNQVLTAIIGGSGDTIRITVLRDGEELDFETAVAQDAEDGRRVIGIVSQMDKSPGTAVRTGFEYTFEMASEMMYYIGQLFTGKGSVDDLVGPVGIVTIIGEQAQAGFIYVAQFLALISLNLAIVNMLPLPALDGGRFLFLIIRLFTGKAISDETEGKIHFAGLMLLFGLMIYIVFQDVGRFILN